MDVDVPWMADPVRDSGHDLHEQFCDALDEFKATVRTISGGWGERLTRAVEAIESARATLAP